MRRRIAVVWLALMVGLAGQQTAQTVGGAVLFRGQAVPGATVTAAPVGGAASAAKTVTTGGDGGWVMAGLKPGAWRVRVTMTGFAPLDRVVTVAAGVKPTMWELRLLPEQGPVRMASDEAAPEKVKPAETGGGRDDAEAMSPPASQPLGGDANRTAASALLVNGSVDNGAASPYFEVPAFGNHRRGQNSLYNGAVGGIFDLSALDASPFSLSGAKAVRPAYLHGTGLAQIGGPLLIPGVFTASSAPMVFAAYQMVRTRNDSIASGLVPTVAERQGDLSQFSGAIIDPASGQSFAGNRIQASGISPQAAALLQLYPLPNVANGPFNYQVPIVSIDHEDHLQARIDKPLNPGNQVAGAFSFQSTRTSAPNLFGFLDSTGSFGLNASVQWRHAFTARLKGTLKCQYSRLRVRQNPYFANRQNVAGEAGISGNDQAPVDWGPPSLTFAGGISGLADLLPANNRNQTSAIGYAGFWNHGNHNLRFGGDFRRLEFNVLGQQNPRGGFTFNGAATGNDWADFLLGIPDAATVAYGNADKYFRESSEDVFVADDMRVGPALTVNAGVRWEYAAPITERQGRLVNLDIAPGFRAVAPVVGSTPTGPLTGQRYPASLVRPDRSGWEPRVGLAWRPFAAASMVVRAGYGIYRNTSVYETMATQMAQQAPLSVSLNVAGSAAHPLTLADGFSAAAGTTPALFAVDPNFRVGSVESWSASVQQDLPGALVLRVSYAGSKGTHAAQEFLPNTYPAGGVNPCPSCPAGFTYLTSGGNSTYEAGTVELERRFVGGFAGQLQYTYGKAIDDGAAGGQARPFVAQDWRNLDGERALSSVDQRQQLSLSGAYTTGMGVHGGALLRGWQGALYKGWTVLVRLSAGSGMPLTPVTFALVPGTGVSGTARPSLTGAPVYGGVAGRYLNPAAYTAPPPGEWGNAGRDSITGPGQFNLDMVLQRSFPVNDRLTAICRIDAENVLNHVGYPSWDTVVGSAQFGLPTTANAMRRVETSVRVTF